MVKEELGFQNAESKLVTGPAIKKPNQTKSKSTPSFPEPFYLLSYVTGGKLTASEKASWQYLCKTLTACFIDILLL